MSKTCILTGVKENDPFYTYTISSIMYYSERIKADFIEGNTIKLPESFRSIDTGKNGDFCLKKLHWIRMALTEYERVIWVDNNCFLHPNMPNLFDIVPETHVGAPAQTFESVLH